MGAELLNLAFSLIISFLLTFYLIPIFCVLAVRLNFLDVPDGKIKKHAQATPYLGGVAVYLGFLVALALTFPFENRMFLFLVGTTLLLFIGLIDDLLFLKPYQKFFGQIIASFCFLKAGLYLKEQFFYNYWTIPVSFVWILGVINAFNLVDVMDGLAALLGISAAISFLLLAFYFNAMNVAILLSSLLGALIAFFWYNKPTAKIYLGDAGSLFIGGFFAVIPFLFSWGIYNPYGYITPLIILAIPLLEVTMLIIVRTYKKIPFYLGSPDHFSIYLRRNGWSKYGILAYVLFLSIILCGVAVPFALGKISFMGVSVLGTLFLLLWVEGLLSKRGGKP